MAPVRRRLVSLAVGIAIAGALAIGLFVGGGGGNLPAPSFSLPRLGGSGSIGLPVRSASGTRLPAVVTFFASWCGPCHPELPALATAVQKLPGVGSRIAVLGIDGNDDPGSGLAFARSSGVTFPVGKDSLSVVAPQFDVPGYPATVFVNSEGYVVEVVRGPISVATFRTWAARIELPAATG